MSVDLRATQAQGNPFPVYEHLRQHEPVSTINSALGGKSFFLTRYEDVWQALKDPRFSSDTRRGGMIKLDKPWMPRIFRSVNNMMLAMDDPGHRRLRDLVHKAFTPAMIARMAQRIEVVSNDLLDQAAQKPEFDFMSGFALPIPLTIISEMLGVPEPDRVKFHHWIASLMEAFSDQPWKMAFHLPKAFKLFGFFESLVELRRKDPQDDLITALVQAEENNDRLTGDELVAMLFLLLLAGHETTVNLLGTGVYGLLQHPDQLQKLHEHPELIESAVEELLRYSSPVEQLGPRHLLEDVEIGGQTLPKGSSVTLGLASANYDETVFANPTQIDITRSPNRHVAFGMGVHYCLGAPLARLEGQIAFQTLVQRYPKMQLAVPAESLKWRGAGGLRGLYTLPLKLHPGNS